MDLTRSLIQRSCQQQVEFMLMAMVMDIVRNVVRVIDTQVSDLDFKPFEHTL